MNSQQMTLPSLSKIWSSGYTTRRLAVGKDRSSDKPEFEVRAPDEKLLGYASTSTGVARLVVCHQIAELKKGAR